MTIQLGYTITILLLLAAHGLTVKFALKRIRDLEHALVARDVLLGKERPLSEAEELFLT